MASNANGRKYRIGGDQDLRLEPRHSEHSVSLTSHAESSVGQGRLVGGQLLERDRFPIAERVCRRDDGVQRLFPTATDRDFRTMGRVERDADIRFAGDKGLDDPVSARHRHIESNVGVSETEFGEVKRD